MKKVIFLFFLFVSSFCISAQKTVVRDVPVAGTLSSRLTKMEKDSVVNLALTGFIDARDFLFIRENLWNLKALDITGVRVKAYVGYEAGPDENQFFSSNYAADAVPAYSFYDLYDLESVLLPPSLKSIGGRAFAMSYGLKSIIIPDSVTTLGASCFSGSEKIASITLGKAVTTIGSECFSFCYGLRDFTTRSTTPQSNAASFFNYTNLSLVTLHAPRGTLPLYQRATTWNQFTAYKELPGLFDLSANYLLAPAAGIPSQTILAETDGTCLVQSNQSWLNAILTKNGPISAIQLSVQPNSTNAYRSATVTVEVKNLEKQVIVVDQEALPKEITLTPGGIRSAISDSALKTTDKLVVKGSMDARDFRWIRTTATKLRTLDLREANIVAYSGTEGTEKYGDTVVRSYPADGVPAYAFFSGTANNLLKKVLFPPTLREIGCYSFYGCLKLDSIQLPTGFKIINEYAFGSCYALSIVSLSDSLSRLGVAAFSQCSSLRKIQLPATCKSIGESCFYSCTKLVEINLPFGMPTIENNLFYECTSLKETTIPPTVKSIGSYSFYHCIQFKKIIVPDSVQVINGSAFSKCYQVDTVVLGYALRTINESVFETCPALYHLESKAEVPPSIGLSSIQDSIRFRCQLIIPFGTKSAYDNAYGWYWFKNVQESNYGVALQKKSVRLPHLEGSSAEVGIRVGSTYDHSWTVQSDQSWLRVNPLTGRTNHTLTLVAELNPNSVHRNAVVTLLAPGFPPKCISVYQMAGPKVLATTAGKLSVDMTASELQDVSDLTVTGTINATDLGVLSTKLPLLRHIDLSATDIVSYTSGGINYAANTFTSLKIDSLESVRLPRTTKIIGGSAFYNCRILKEVYLGDSLTTINSNAFEYCASLTSIVFPAKMNKYAYYSFSGCTNLRSVTVRNPVPVTFEYAMDDMVVPNMTLYVPYNTKSLYQATSGWRWFGSHVENKGFIMGTTLASYGRKGGGPVKIAFASNAPWTVKNVPNWLKVTPTSGEGSDTLRIFADPNTDPVRRNGFFRLTYQDIEEHAIKITQDPGVKTVYTTADSMSNQLTKADYTDLQELIIHGTLNARDFKQIRNKLDKLKYLDLSDVTIVSYTGLDGTSPSGSSEVYPANTLPQYAFTKSNSNYFVNNNTLVRVLLPQNLVAVGREAFADCYALDSIWLPNTVTAIDRSAFYSGGLKYIQLSDNLQSIGRSAFSYDTRLTSVILPNQLKSMETYAFTGCSSLRKINVPASLTFIGDYVFQDCNVLNTITTFASNPLDISNSLDVFLNVSSTKCTLYVPRGSLNAYREASQWNKFVNMIEMEAALENSTGNSKIGVYPNPFLESFSISGITGMAEVVVTDLNGKIRIHQQVLERESISLSNCPSGFYLVSIRTDMERSTFKVLKKY